MVPVAPHRGALWPAQESVVGEKPINFCHSDLRGKGRNRNDAAAHNLRCGRPMDARLAKWVVWPLWALGSIPEGGTEKERVET